MTDEAETTPSATVVLLRDGADLELLLMQRTGRKGKPGAWVFPGGRVEAHDVRGGDPRSEASARLAGVRETAEESGLAIDDLELATISRWITPPVSPRRFDTWFFVGVVDGEAPVRPDGEEMVGHRWLSPRTALADYRDGRLALAPPTFVTVTWLSAFDRAAAAARRLGAGEPMIFRPQIHRTAAGEVVMLYPGDVGYETGEVEVVGPRHRCVMADGRLRYERD